MKVALRIVALCLLVAGALWASAWIRDALEMELMPHNEALMHRMIVTGLLLLFALMALPFLPGAEVGLALLSAFGAAIAPAVYLTVVLALITAFAVGRLVPINKTAQLLRNMRMTRAANFLDGLSDVPPEEILDHILKNSPASPMRALIRFRYVLIIFLINTPGNFVIKDGGGIALVAGLSRCFHPFAYFVAIAIAVLPVPLMATLIGPD